MDDRPQCPCCYESTMDYDFTLLTLVCPRCDLHMSISGYELDMPGWIARKRREWERKQSVKAEGKG